MRALLTFLLCCSSVWCLAQAPTQHLRIQISYDRGSQHLEQAVETIEAVNVVSPASSVDYQAGRSVTLLPGFEARQGSIFTAFIKPVTLSAGRSEFPLKLSAFPNPFDQVTTIEYYLPADGKVNLWVTDAQGKVVGKLLQDETQAAGQHRVEWKPASLSSGVYMPIVEANQQRAVSRIIKK
ncbi:hypothetical protein GGR92_003000 [Spirosoma lacussanchae]|uniref:T9SS type A sorting domain-containing protein n=1 Tax=Spirosoma lacussanchae TaxID=1884249 RepID=UPI001107B949|nr:T9SS type A sorting domain-containing protein [Spirosoma lacussanchae]